MIRYESTRKLAYSSFGAAILFVLIVLINLQNPMVETTFQNILTLFTVFFCVIGIALLTVAKDDEESIRLVYKSD
jgi:uncharacterized membrane protein